MNYITDGPIYPIRSNIQEMREG